MKTFFCALLGLCLAGLAAPAQTTSFTYQGRLTDSGGFANGIYDLRFTLHDTPAQPNTVGVAVTNAPTTASNGLFTVTLDFGSSVFTGGSNRWLQIGVRPFGDTNDYTVLLPRQFLTSTPYAIQALNAATANSASTLSSPLAGTNLVGTVPDTRLSTNVALLNTNLVFFGSLTATQFVGNGSGLTNIPITSIVGVFPDARLSTNVAFLNTNVTFKTVTASNFIGNGAGLTNVPGRLFDFIPTGVSIQGAGNTGYLATNATSPVVVTLPVAPALGTTVRVSGGAAGGWIVAQNAGQSILVANLPNSVGLSWSPVGASLAWKAAAASGDGGTMAAAVNGGQIYISTDHGATFTARAGNGAWQSVASSADGTKLVAVATSQQINTSGDSGTTWSPHGSAAAWTAVASSIDGSKLLASVSGGGLFRSTDSGSTWGNVLNVALGWTGVASSADGTKLAACPTSGQIMTSTNGGGNWVARDVSRNWQAIACSADGSVLVAAATGTGGQLYTSYDSGETWSPTGPGASAWTAVTCSADGSKMLAVYTTGGIYSSTDSGRTWIAGQTSTFSSFGWKGVAISGDGSSALALPNGQPIYVYSQATTTSGTSGFLTGTKQSAIELQYIGNGVFMPVSYVGAISVH